MPDRWPILLMVRELGIGGCERDLTKIALRLDRGRFQPHVACFIDQGFRGEELRAAGVPVVRFPVRSLRSFSAIQGALEMGRYVRRHRIQLLHAFDVPSDIFGVPVARLFGVRHVIASQLSYRYMYSRGEQRLLALTDPLADRIVVNSHAVAKHLIESEKVHGDKIVVSHNGVDVGEFYPAPVRRREPLRDASLVIGALCALRSEKRLDLLIRAFAAVRQIDPGMKLAIIGSGTELPNLEGLAVELGIREDCHFSPSTAEVANWLHSFDVFVLSSFSESFPNVLLEAMACGCACAASSVGGVPEMITHGTSGLLFESGDLAALIRALELLIRDPEYRKRLGRNAASVAREEFSIELNVHRAEELYESLLIERRTPAAVKERVDVNT